MPDSLDFARLRAVFLAASRLTGTAREDYLAAACDGERALFEEVRAMLAHHDAPPSWLRVGERRDADAVLGSATSAATTDRERWVGPYRMLDRIGAGSVGVVHRAEQQNPRRIVALKLLQLGAMREDILARFLREAEILARLQHPSIAQVFDAGAVDTPLGPQPYFTMEYVDGQPLTRHASMRGLDRAARCRLLVQLCAAVQHAHDRGIIHRDLKPANVLVVDREHGDGLVKVLDFGIARSMEDDTARSALLTQQGQLVGTLHYVSPEQLRGEAVDVRTDVYALGAVAYELLTGRTPFDLDGQPWSRVLAIVADHEPERLRSIDPTLERDLEAVVGTALEKRPIDRYPSAAAMGADLERVLRGEAVRVRRPGWFERCRRFCDRHRALVGSIAATILVLILAIVVVSLYAAHNQRLAVAERSASLAERRSRYFTEMNLASTALGEGSVARVAEIVAAWSPATVGEFVARGWEWRFLDRVAATAETVIRADGVQFAVGWLPDGRFAAHDERGLSVWNPATGVCDRAIHGRSSDFIGAAIARSGRLAAVRWDDTLRIHALDDGSLRATFPCVGVPVHFAWHPDSDRVLIADAEGLALWDVATGTRLRAASNRFDRVAFVGRSRFVAYDIPGGIAVHELEALRDASSSARTSLPQPILRLPESDPVPLAIEVDASGHCVAAAMVDGFARIWDLADGRLLAKIAHEDHVLTVAWSPAGDRLASAGRDHTIRVWHRATGTVDSLHGHGNAVWGLAFGGDGHRLASASEDGTIRIWPPHVNRADASFSLGVLAGADETTGRLSFTSDDGVAIAMPSRRDSQRLRMVGQARATQSSARMMEHWSANLERFAYAEDRALVLCDANGDVLHRVELDPADGMPNHGNGGLELDPTGRSIAVARRGDGVGVWIWCPERGVPPTLVQTGWTTAFAWSPDGETLAICSDKVVLVARDGGRVVGSVPIARGVAVAWHQGGDRLAVADHGMRIHLVSRSSGAVTRVLRGHLRTVRSLAWHPDGSRLASGGNDDRVRVWETETGHEVLALRHSDDVFAVAWDRRGETLATAGEDGEVWLWRAVRESGK